MAKESGIPNSESSDEFDPLDPFGLNPKKPQNPLLDPPKKKFDPLDPFGLNPKKPKGPFGI